MTKQRDLVKLDPTEWRALRSYPPAPRCFWVEAIFLMQEAEPYGHLLIDGRAPTYEELAEVASVPAWQMPWILDKLEEAGVISRTAEGVIYSPRMVKEEKRRQVARRNGKAGGNPRLRESKEKSAAK